MRLDIRRSTLRRFAWLEIALSLALLYMVLLLYINQRRDDQLAELREQLALQLALLSDQKTAKVIQLLEEFRRDIQLVDDRADPQAEAMARPVEPDTVLEAIKQTRAEAEGIATSDRESFLSRRTKTRDARQPEIRHERHLDGVGDGVEGQALYRPRRQRQRIEQPDRFCGRYRPAAPRSRRASIRSGARSLGPRECDDGDAAVKSGLSDYWGECRTSPR